MKEFTTNQIRADIRSLLTDTINDFKFNIVDYRERSKKIVVVIETKINNVIHPIPASGTTVNEVADILKTRYNDIVNGGTKHNERYYVSDSQRSVNIINNQFNLIMNCFNV